MSRYFFEIRNGDGTTLDPEGMELESRDKLVTETGRIMLDIVQEELPERESGSVSVIVRDEGGKVISMANLSFTNHWLD